MILLPTYRSGRMWILEARSRHRWPSTQDPSRKACEPTSKADDSSLAKIIQQFIDNVSRLVKMLQGFLFKDFSTTENMQSKHYN